jgi:hypothetical protein
MLRIIPRFVTPITNEEGLQTVQQNTLQMFAAPENDDPEWFPPFLWYP